MRLVCLTPRLPISDLGAGESYVRAYLLRMRALGWTTTVLAPSTDENIAVSKRWDGSPGDLILSPADATVPPLRAALRALARGHAQTPISKYWSSLADPARQALHAADVIDLQFAESIRLAPELRRRLPRSIIVAMAHDILAQSSSRARLSPSAAVRVKAFLTRRQLVGAERAGLAVCDEVYVFNPGNVGLLHSLGVTSPVFCATPYVDVREAWPSVEQNAKRVAFFGAMWRPENAEAAEWFMSAIWPVVREHIPDAKLRLVGDRPSSSLIRRANEDVEVTGYLPDLLDGYQGVSIIVAPLVRGAGLKFKVVQALAMGFPVVATTVALEGIPEWLSEEDLGPLRAIDDPIAFAYEIVAYLNGRVDMEAWRRLGQRVRQRMDFTADVTARSRRYRAAVKARRGPQ